MANVAEVGAEDAKVLEGELTWTEYRDIYQEHSHVNGHHATNKSEKPFVGLGPVLWITGIIR